MTHVVLLLLKPRLQEEPLALSGAFTARDMLENLFLYMSVKWCYLHSFMKPSQKKLLAHCLNSSRSPACIKATMVLVTDVPMLEPMMMGMADYTSSTAEVKRNSNIFCRHSLLFT